MRTVKFNSEEEFLKELDGKVYAISDKGGEFLCDILEDDFCKLLDSGDIINLCDTSVDYKIMSKKAHVFEPWDELDFITFLYILIFILYINIQ